MSGKNCPGGAKAPSRCGVITEYKLHELDIIRGVYGGRVMILRRRPELELMPHSTNKELGTNSCILPLARSEVKRAWRISHGS